MRIAHLSDLHLRHHLPGTATNANRLSRAMPQRLAEALAHIQTLSPDLLVVSGDLLDYPMDEMDNAQTQAQALQDLELIAALLNAQPYPYVFVHGNHDHPALIDQVFGNIPNDQIIHDSHGNGHRVITFRDDEGENHVPVRVGKEKARYNAALQDVDSLPQIHIQHYVVWPERNEDYPHTYGKGAQMREELIAAGNVALVLSGHYHIGVPLFFDKGVWFATVRGFTEAPHPYNLYEIDGDTITEHTFTLV